NDELEKTRYRLTVSELTVLTAKLGLPAVVFSPEGDRVLRCEAFAICCRHLIEPARWRSIESEFNRSKDP
ncbi:TPA: hypothetical protein N0F65_009513, partial [Lagenidium giganteum]